MSELKIGLSFQARESQADVFSTRPTVFTAWGLDDLYHETRDPTALRGLPWGALVGCEDGTAYIFHPDLAISKSIRRKCESHSSSCRASTSNVLDGHGLQIPHRRPQHLSISRSRDVSPVGSRTNLAAMPAQKSRAVSGLSKAQAEAPKNFVDFEDEQERMKEMISERAVKDVKDRSPRTSLAPYDSPRRRTLDDALSLASVETTSSRQTPPISPTLSPSTEPSSSTSYSKALMLRVQITPQIVGIDHGVSDIKVMPQRGSFLVLQSSGQVSLFRLNDGECVASITLPPVLHSRVAPPETPRNGEAVRLWSWRSFDIYEEDETKVLLTALAVPDERLAALEIGDAAEQTRIALLELTYPLPQEIGDVILRLVADNSIRGSSGSISVTNNSGKLEVYQLRGNSLITMSSISQDLSLETIPVPEPESSKTRLLSDTIAALMPKSEQILERTHGQSVEKNACEVQREVTLGCLHFSTPPESLKVVRSKGDVYGAAWSEDQLMTFDISSGKIRTRATIALSGHIRKVCWVGYDVLLLDYGARHDMHVLPGLKSQNSSSEGEASSSIPKSTIITTVSLTDGEILSNLPSRRIILLNCSSKQSTIFASGDGDGSFSSRRTLWSNAGNGRSGGRRITALHPLDLDHVFVGTDAADLHALSLHDLMSWKVEDTRYRSRKNSFAILSLFQVTNDRTGQMLVFGGGDDGSISVWDARSLKPLARWVLFCEPLVRVMHLTDDCAGSLRNCCMCFSRDGTIAIIAIDNLNFLFLIPGAPTQLSSMAVSPENLMLVYVDRRARLWDMKTKEFWRSMRLEKAFELLSKGDWKTFDMEKSIVHISESVGLRNHLSITGNPPPVVLLDVEMILKDHANLISSDRNFKAILSVLHTPGLDEQTDRVAATLFRSDQRIEVLMHRVNEKYGDAQSFLYGSPHAAWCISPIATTMRLLVIVSLLRTFLTRKDSEMQATTLLSFYTLTLPVLIGSQYEPPDLSMLVRFWDDSPVPDVRASAKDIFDSELNRLNDDIVIALVERWRHKLPFLLPPDERQSEQVALALSLCGKLGIEKYALLTSMTLGDISKSIVMYLNDNTSPHRALAIELCSQGFETWQLYIDAKDALRSIFTLATSSSKNVSIKNPGPAARSAVVQIATNNSPLFMTTLSLDILHPRSVEYSRVIMHMIAFLIRRRPLVLLPSLPRLMEAVVKSLDPGSNSDREAVLDTATEVIALVVQTYPTLDFHGGSQRLAVGTSEGAVIMYDLKTATRLYVLEGHRKRLSGISFSPDGRRMVTLSIEESIVLVWKVGTSFVSFFTPGAPPRQGHAGSDPYKTIPFIVQDQESLTVEETLKEVHFDWQSDRSVRISIREAVFTFGT